MDEYGFSDYGMFEDAASSVDSLCGDISSDQTAIQEVKNVLSDSSVFMGPSADSCLPVFDKIHSKLTSMDEYFHKISDFLLTASNNYKQADVDASTALNNAFSSLGFVGKTQASSFHALGDRAYQGDPAAKQEWIEKVAKIVDSAQYSKYGLKNSLLIAQVINESGWMHTPTKVNDDGTTLADHNNVLGMNTNLMVDINAQDSSWSKNPKSSLNKVSIYDSNNNIAYENQMMRSYDSVEQCIEDYANILYIKHPECKGSNNLEDYRSFLEGYTPVPGGSVVDKYAKIIADYGLEKYDRT